MGIVMVESSDKTLLQELWECKDLIEELREKLSPVMLNVPKETAILPFNKSLSMGMTSLLKYRLKGILSAMDI